MITLLGKYFLILVISITQINVICELCPPEINNDKLCIIGKMEPGNYTRFSQCFYCIGYKTQGYINRTLCLFNNTIYEISESQCQANFDLSKNLTGSYYNLLLIDANDTNVDYLIYFVGYNKYINLFHYSLLYNNYNNENYFVKKKIINDKRIEDPKSLSCQIHSTNKDLICFYIIKPYLYVEFLNIYNFSTTYQNNITFEFKNNSLITLKSSITSNNNKIFIVWEQKRNKAYYNIFEYDGKIFKNSTGINNCNTSNQLMEVYFYNNEFFLFCNNANNVSQYYLYSINKDSSELNQMKYIINITKREIKYNMKTFFLDDFNEECNLTYNINSEEKNELDTSSKDSTSKELSSIDSFIIDSTLIDPFSSDLFLTNSPSTNPISTYIYPKDYSSLTIFTSIIESSSDLTSTYIPFTDKPPKDIPTENTVNHYELSIPLSSTLIYFTNIMEIQIKKEYLLSNITEILKGKEPGQIYKIKEEGYTIIIKPINSIIEPNSTYINFGECENILRNSNNISNSSFLTVLQIELDNNNSQSLINQVEYEIYDQNFSKLNLNVCKDTDIQIIYAIKDDILIDIEKINNLKNLGVDAFNINDSFFWDVCEPYSSDTGNDLILEDRIKDLYQNYSLCEEGCTYNDLSLENMTVSCNCKIKENITIVVSEINLDQIKYETTSNFDIIKCYDIIFKFKLKITNIGFWIFTILLILHFPLIFHYFYTGIQPIHNFVINEMIKYGYLTNKQQPNSNIKNKTNKGKKGKKKKNKNNPPQKKKKSKNKKINNVLVIQNNIIKNSYNKLSKPLDSKNIINKDNKNRRKNKKKKLNKKINLSVNSTTKIDNSKSLIKNKRKNNGLTNMETENPVDKEKTNKNKIIDFTLITINLNHKKFNDYTPNQSYRVLNNYTFEEAIKYDHRAICEIFFIYLISKQAIFHAFFFKSPLQLFSLRLCLLFFIFSSDLALNAFFYFNDNISKKYHNAKNLLLFTFNNNLTVILLSTFIGFVLLTLFIKLTNCTNAMREVFQNEEEKMKKDKKYKVTNERKIEIKNEIEKIFKNYKIKIIVFIILELLFMIFFWYFVIIFCHVYKSTQTSWILDSFLTILSRIIIDCLICLGFAKLYRIGVESNIHCIYKFAMFLYGF